MSRSHGEPNNQVQSEKPGAGMVPPTGETPVAPSAASGRMTMGWRLALFIWATSFIFLWLYELLSAVRRALAGD